MLPSGDLSSTRKIVKKMDESLSNSNNNTSQADEDDNLVVHTLDSNIILDDAHNTTDSSFDVSLGSSVLCEDSPVKPQPDELNTNESDIVTNKNISAGLSPAIAEVNLESGTEQISKQLQPGLSHFISVEEPDVPVLSTEEGCAAVATSESTDASLSTGISDGERLEIEFKSHLNTLVVSEDPTEPIEFISAKMKLSASTLPSDRDELPAEVYLPLLLCSFVLYSAFQI